MREVLDTQSPEQQISFMPQDVLSGNVASGGQSVAVPSQTSGASQSPLARRQTAPSGSAVKPHAAAGLQVAACWQVPG